MFTKSFAATSVAVFLIAPLAYAADRPLPVTVTNPVLPVEVSNANPISVTVAGSDEASTTAAAPTCDFINQCIVTFNAVPAGHVLRVSRIFGSLLFTSADGFALLRTNAAPAQHLVFTPVTHFGAAFYGSVFSFNQEVDVVFTAGQVPVLEIGTSSTFFIDTRNRLGITATLIAVP